MPADHHRLYGHPDVQAASATDPIVEREVGKNGAEPLKSARDRKMIVRRVLTWVGFKSVTPCSEESRQASAALDLDKFARLLYSGDVADLKQIGQEFKFSDLTGVWRQMPETIDSNFRRMSRVDRDRATFVPPLTKRCA